MTCTNRSFRDLQENGLAAWDCVFDEDVLYIPWFLACLGDNPMQSELASHIGLQGKFFCRVCHARGKDSQRPKGPQADRDRVNEFLHVGEYCESLISMFNYVVDWRTTET